MNRTIYFSFIEEKLNTLATRINSRGRLNILDLHSHSETFYQYFLQELFGWTIFNENEVKANVEAIDLIDHENKLLIQVSATSTKKKIEDSLSKDIIERYKAYTFKFISISKDSDNLKKMVYCNPHSISFDPGKDIIDTNSILTFIKGMNIDDQKRIYTFIKKELADDIDLVRLESNLANVINVLSKENLDQEGLNMEINPYEISRKMEYNKLNAAVLVIEEYSIHYGKLDKIYQEFDLLGSSKSMSVFSAISGEYRKAMNDFSGDKLFFQVIDKVIERILNSANYQAIPYEELELCVYIIVVDAFIRCKIFRNPENYNYATT